MRRRQRGFTLIELMTVVAIIGVLAAVAIPMFMTQFATSKRSEGELFLDRIKISVKALLPDRGGFPVGTTGLTPAVPCCDRGRKDRKCDVDLAQWASGDPDDPSVWEELSFKLEEPHYFQYSYVGTSTSFTAHAVGNLDCDAQQITYTLVGTITDGSPTYVSSKSAKAD